MGLILTKPKNLLEPNCKLKAQSDQIVASKLEEHARAIVAFLDTQLCPDITSLIMQALGCGCAYVDVKNIIKHHFPLAIQKRTSCHGIHTYGQTVEFSCHVDLHEMFQHCTVTWNQSHTEAHVGDWGIRHHWTVSDTNLDNTFKEWKRFDIPPEDKIPIGGTLDSKHLVVTRLTNTQFAIHDRDDVGWQLHQMSRFRKKLEGL